MFHMGEIVIYKEGPDREWPAMIQQVSTQTKIPIYMILIFKRPANMFASAKEGLDLYEVRSQYAPNRISDAHPGQSRTSDDGSDDRTSSGQHSSGKDSVRRDYSAARSK